MVPMSTFVSMVSTIMPISIDGDVVTTTVCVVAISVAASVYGICVNPTLIAMVSFDNEARAITGITETPNV